MFYLVFEKYCKEVLECHAYDILNISRGCWYRFQKEGILPLEYCKIICYHFDHHIIENQEELSGLVISKFYEVA
jgi:hypothetical protein